MHHLHDSCDCIVRPNSNPDSAWRRGVTGDALAKYNLAAFAAIYRRDDACAIRIGYRFVWTDGSGGNNAGKLAKNPATTTVREWL